MSPNFNSFFDRFLEFLDGFLEFLKFSIRITLRGEQNDKRFRGKTSKYTTLGPVSLLASIATAVFSLFSGGLFTQVMIGIATSIAVSAVTVEVTMRRSLLAMLVKSLYSQMFKNDSLAQMYFNRKAKTTLLQVCLPSSSILLLWGYSLYSNQVMPQSTTILLCLILVLVILKHMIFSYRVEKGLFGTTESELRELAYFILSKIEDDDMHGPDGKRRPVFNSGELQKLVEEAAAAAHKGTESVLSVGRNL